MTKLLQMIARRTKRGEFKTAVTVKRERALTGDGARKLRQLEAENVRLRETLRWYATRRMDGSKVCHQCKTITVMDCGDEGKRARAALGER